MKFKVGQKVIYWDSGKHPLVREPHLNGREAIVEYVSINNVYIQWTSPEFHRPDSRYDYGVYPDNLIPIGEQMTIPFGSESI